MTAQQSFASSDMRRLRQLRAIGLLQALSHTVVYLQPLELPQPLG